MGGLGWKRSILGSSDGKESILSEAGGGAPTFMEPIEGHVIKAPQLPTSLGPGAMIRKGNWKLSVYHDDLCELYDLANDPHELKNLYEDEEYDTVRVDLTLDLTKRLLGVKVRDVGMNWPTEKYPIDVRFEALQKAYLDPSSITGLKRGLEA